MLNFLLILVVLLEVFLSTGCSSIVNQKKQVEIAHINTKLGLLYLRQGYPKIAKSKLLLAYKKAPHDPEVCNALGYFFSNMGELAAAKKYYLIAIKLADEKSWFWHNYGRFLYQHGYYKEGLRYFLFAADNPNYLYIAEAYADASRAAFNLNQKDLAKRYRNEALIRGFDLKSLQLL